MQLLDTSLRELRLEHCNAHGMSASVRRNVGRWPQSFELGVPIGFPRRLRLQQFGSRSDLSARCTGERFQRGLHLGFRGPQSLPRSFVHSELSVVPRNRAFCQRDEGDEESK